MAIPVPSRDLTALEQQLLLDAKNRYESDVTRALAERDRLITRLAEDGASVAQIGKVLEMSRQGVYDAIGRRRALSDGPPG